ncbi:flagellar basal body rod C-terminal domain-containing protein [Sulfurospirillum sp. 1612]|uniref:flagellar basal body rod C-terminal domain-containing protein n=1 Tax=Sulfurospirillum sp. 1612 TaxID=3094835 RepID=UPI002F957E3D
MQVNLSSMRTYEDWLSNNSNNIANVNTQDYKAIETTLKNSADSVTAHASNGDNGVDLAKEITDQIVIKNGFQANVSAIKTQDEMIGSVLDLLA